VSAAGSPAAPPAPHQTNDKSDERLTIAMYGTIARMRVKSDHAQQLQAINDEWTRERGHEVDGFVVSSVLRPDEMILVANIPRPRRLHRYWRRL
jgi:hypothetical protein